MDIKGIILGIAIIILTIFVTFYGISTIFPKPMYEDFCDNYAKPYPITDAREVCATVCIPVYEIDRNQCVYNECGSGCGPDKVVTFETREECEQGL